MSTLPRLIRILLPWAMVAVAVAWFIVWSTGQLTSTGDWSAREPLLAVGFGAFVILTWVYSRLATRQMRSAEHYFQGLARMSNADVVEGEVSLPPLDANNPLYPTAQQFQSAHVDNCARLRQVEHQRAGLELRVRRNATKQEQLEAILTGLTEPVVVVDQFDSLVIANPSAERLLGIDGKQAGQRALNQLTRCDALLDLLTDLRRRKGPSQKNAELELCDAQGTTRTYNVQARTLELKGDTSAEHASGRQCAVAVLRDISNVKAIHKRNAEFISSVSHEMKTPLAGIKAYVELLVDGDAEDDRAREEFLSVINNQANRLQRLIDNLLNMARIEAGVVHVHKAQRSLNELLEEAARIVQPVAAAKNQKLTLELSPLYIGVFVDRDMLMQVAINLLSNAIKYTPDGGQVTLRSRVDGDWMQFDVQDNGVGLSEDDRAKVFEKFYRVKKDREMAAGTGLGLPLAKHIVEAIHGGKLTVSSVLGLGSTFTVAIPTIGSQRHD